jgi:hypothetical protein
MHRRRLTILGCKLGTMDAREKLDDICKGVMHDLYHLEEALTLVDFIGSHAVTLNAAFGAFFGALQIILGRVLLLHSARIFEQPKRLYPTRCVPAALALLRTEADNFAVSAKPAIVSALARAGVAIW